MGPVRGVIFDVDGTLVDSNDAHARAWVAALREGGHDVPFERVRALIGMGGDKLLPEVSDVDKGSPEGERLSRRWQEIFAERELPRLRPFPQTRELARRMRDDGLTLAVASSSEPDLLDRLLTLARIDDLLETATSAGDANASKPDPDIIQAALDRLGLPPDEVVMIGDTPYDIEAAGKAGVRAVAVRCGGWGDGDLAGALAVYDDPADLLARYDRSPLGAPMPAASAGAAAPAAAGPAE